MKSILLNGRWMMLLVVLSVLPFTLAYQDQYTSTDFPYNASGVNGCRNEAYLPLFVCENLNINGTYITSQKAIRLRNVTLNMNNQFSVNNKVSLASVYSQAQYAAILIEDSLIYARGDEDGEGDLNGNLTLKGKSIRIFDTVLNTYGTDGAAGDGDVGSIDGSAGTGGGNSSLSLLANQEIVLYNVTWNSWGGRGGNGGNGGPDYNPPGCDTGSYNCTAQGGEGGAGGSIVVFLNASSLSISHSRILWQAGSGGKSGKIGDVGDVPHILCAGGNYGGKGGESTIALNALSFSVFSSFLNLSGGNGGDSILFSDSNDRFSGTPRSCEAATSTGDGGSGGQLSFSFSSASFVNLSKSNLTFSGGDGGFGGSDETTVPDAERCSNGGGKGGDVTLLMNASSLYVEYSLYNVSGGKGGIGYSCDDGGQKGYSLLNTIKDGGFVVVRLLGANFVTHHSKLFFVSRGAATLNGDSETPTPFGNNSNVSVVFNLSTKFVAGNMTYVNVSAGRAYTDDPADMLGNASFRVFAKGMYLGYSDGISSGFFMTEKNSGFTNNWILLGDTPKLLVNKTFIRDAQGRLQSHNRPYSINISPAYCDGLHNVTFCIINDEPTSKEQSVNYAYYVQPPPPLPYPFCPYFKYDCDNIWGDAPVIRQLQWHPYPTGDNDNLSLYVNCTDDGGGTLTVDYKIYRNKGTDPPNDLIFELYDYVVSNGILVLLNTSDTSGQQNISSDDTEVGDVFRAEVKCKDSDGNFGEKDNSTTIRNSKSEISGCPKVSPPSLPVERLGETVYCATQGYVSCSNDGNPNPPGGFQYEYKWYVIERSRTFALFKDDFESWTDSVNYGDSCPEISLFSKHEHLWDTCVSGSSSITHVAGFNHSYSWWSGSTNKPSQKGNYLLTQGSTLGNFNLGQMYLETMVENAHKCTGGFTLDFWNIKNKSGNDPTLDCFVYVSTDGVNYNQVYTSAGHTLGTWYNESANLSSYRQPKVYLRLNASGTITAGYWKACGWENFAVNCTVGNPAGRQYSDSDCNGANDWGSAILPYAINTYSTGKSNMLDLSGLDNFNSDNSDIICETRCALADIEEPDDFDWSAWKNSSNAVKFVQKPNFNKSTYILANETMFQGYPGVSDNSLAMIEFDDVDGDDNYLEMFIARGNYPFTPMTNYISLLSPTAYLFQDSSNSYYNRNRSWSLWDYGSGSNHNHKYIDAAPSIIKSMYLYDINSQTGKDLIIGANSSVFIYNRTLNKYNPSDRSTFRSPTNHNFYRVNGSFYNFPVMNFTQHFGAISGFDIRMHDFDEDDVPELLIADAQIPTTDGKGAVRFFNYIGSNGTFPPGFIYKELFKSTSPPYYPQLAFKIGNRYSTAGIGIGDFNGDNVSDVTSTQNVSLGTKALKYYGAPVDYPSVVELDLFRNGNWQDPDDVNLSALNGWMDGSSAVIRYCTPSPANPFCPEPLMQMCVLSGSAIICYRDIQLIQDYILDCDTASSAHPEDYAPSGSSLFYGTCDYNLSTHADKGKVKVYNVEVSFNMTNSPKNTSEGRSDLAMALSNLLWKTDCSSFEQYGGGDYSSYLFSGNPLYSRYCVVPITFCTYANTSSLRMNVSGLNITYYECD